MFTTSTFNISVIVFLILMCITFILLDKYTSIEEFTPLSIEYSEGKALSRTKLQFLLNDYETTDTCRRGYTQPSNPCSYSYNTNFYPYH